MIVLYVKDDGECWFSSVKVSGAAHGFYAWITIDFRAELAGLYRLAASLNPHMHSHFMEMALYVEVRGNYSECDDKGNCSARVKKEEKHHGASWEARRAQRNQSPRQ